MTKPTNDEQYELQARIEGVDRTSLPQGPGPYFYWFLGHHVKADQVRFAEVFVDEENTQYHARSGQVFLVTDSAIIFSEYLSAAVEEDPRDRGQDFGTVNITMYSKVAAPCESIKWTGRSLRIKKSNYGDGSRPARLEKGSIAVNGRGWEVQLPAHSLDGADEYFDQLRTALGLS